MQSQSIEQWTHDHAFLGERHDENERRTWFVVALTLIMMVGEIVAGSLFGSMALLADGMQRRSGSQRSPIASRASTSAMRISRSAPASSVISPPFPARSSWA